MTLLLKLGRVIHRRVVMLPKAPASFGQMTGRSTHTACVHARAAALWRHTAALTFGELAESQREKKQHHTNFFSFF